MDVINVTIKNLTGKDRLLTWLPQGQKWLQANRTVTIPYEPWGQASVAQREAMAAAVLSGCVAFTLYAMGTDGQVHAIPYNPAYGYKLKAVTTKPAALPKREDKEFQADRKSHTVMAGKVGEDNAYKAMGFKSEEVKPPSSVNGEIEQDGIFKGFTKSASGNIDRLRANASAATEEVAPEEEPDTEDGIKEAFAALIDSKQWDAALALLKDTFGEDKITFNVRTVMSMKNYDAIVAKYNLKG